MTIPRDQDDDPFVREVRKQAERAQVDQHVTFWQGLGLVGSVGWMVVLPMLIGALLGRWFDLEAGTEVFWSLSLLFAGLVLGCISAWRHVHKELER